MALKEKEKLFCSYYSELRNARSAAAKAGYGILTHRSAVKLLAREEIRKEIERIDRTRLVSAEEVIAGYRQLAFGFRPRLVIVTSLGNHPSVYDQTNNVVKNTFGISTDAGGTGIEITSSGFKAMSVSATGTQTNLNQAGTSYSYIAFK